MGSPGGSGVRIHLQCRRHWRFGFDPWSRKIPCRRKWQPILVFLSGKWAGGAWQATVHGVAKSRTQLSDKHTCSTKTALATFPGGTSAKDPACQYKRLRFDPWVGMIPWRAQQPTPAFLPGKPHGQRSLAGYSPWVAKSRTRLK